MTISAKALVNGLVLNSHKGHIIVNMVAQWDSSLM